MTRPLTIAEKILAAHAGVDEVAPGQLIECDLSLAQFGTTELRDGDLFKRYVVMELYRQHN